MAGTWMRLAHVALSGAGDTIDSGTFTAKEKLKVIIHGKASSDISFKVRFNGATSNYAFRSSLNGGSDGTDTSEGYINIGTSFTGTADIFGIMSITNKSDKEKLVISECMATQSGAGNAPERKEVIGKWAETSNQITSITVHNSGSGSYDTGSYITVFGASGDVVSDEKTTLTNVETGTRYEETDTRKIYRMALGGTMSSLDDDFSSYSDQAAANASWVPTNNVAALRVDTSANVLKWEVNNSYGTYPSGVTNCNTLKDLGVNAITGDFTLKFKFRILSNGNAINYNCSCIFGIYESTAVNDTDLTTDSGIGIQPTFQSADESIRFNVQYNDNNYNRSGSSFDSVLPADVDDYWVKIVRSGNTTTCYVYSDAYSTLMRPALSKTDAKTKAFRYIGFKNFMKFNAGGGNYATFEVDDVELELGSAWTERGTA